MTDENLTWDQAFSNAVAIVEGAYSLKYTTLERAALRETLHRHIRQPLRLVKIAKLIPDSYKQFGDKLPTPEFWRRIHKESGYVAPNTYGHACQKCDDTGWIQVEVDRGNYLNAEVAVCDCPAGEQHLSDFTKPLLRFEGHPRIAAAIQDGRIYFENGTAKVRATGEIVCFKRRPEKEPEPKPEPVTVQGELEDDVPF